MFDEVTVKELTIATICLYQHHRKTLSLAPEGSPKVKGCVCAFLLFSDRYEDASSENMIKCFTQDTKKYINDVWNETSFSAEQVANINDQIDVAIKNKDYQNNAGFLLATLASCFLKKIIEISASEAQREEYLTEFRTANPEYNDILSGVRMLIAS